MADKSGACSNYMYVVAPPLFLHGKLYIFCIFLESGTILSKTNYGSLRYPMHLQLSSVYLT